MWPKGFCSAIASCNATVTFFHGHADGVTRELTWCSVSFEAEIRDFYYSTQVANFLLKLEFLDESTTGSSQSTEDICGKFSETEPPSATLSPRDRCQSEQQKVLLAKVADKSFSRYVCGQMVITGVGSELWRVTLVKDSLFLRVGPIFDKPNFQG